MRLRRALRYPAECQIASVSHAAIPAITPPRSRWSIFRAAGAKVALRVRQSSFDDAFDIGADFLSPFLLGTVCKSAAFATTIRFADKDAGNFFRDRKSLGVHLAIAAAFGSVAGCRFGEIASLQSLRTKSSKSYVWLRLVIVSK